MNGRVEDKSKPLIDCFRHYQCLIEWTRILNRFVDMGYRREDVEEAYWKSPQYFKGTAKLTDKGV